jgi:hypothetical protein
MYMQVDKSRRNYQPASIETFTARVSKLIRPSNVRNPSVAQEDVHRRVDPRCRVDNVAASN